MYPDDIQILGYSFHIYGLFIALAFFLSYFLFQYLCKTSGLPWGPIKVTFLLCITVGYAGAKLLDTLVHWPSETRPDQPFIDAYIGSGAAFYGIPLFAIPFGGVLLKLFKIPILPVLDLGAIILTFSQIVGRLGCFARGCCYGAETSSFIGMKFYSPSIPSHLHGIPLHPVQLYFSLSTLLLFIFLLWLKGRKIYHGQLLCWYLAGQGVTRFILEFFRGDDTERGMWLGLSTGQHISILFLLMGIALGRYLTGGIFVRNSSSSSKDEIVA